MEEVEALKPDGEHKELKLLIKIMDMIVYAEPVLMKYPRYVRYTRVADIMRCMDTIMEKTIEANKKYYRKTTMQELDVEIEKLRKYIRLSYDLKYINEKTRKLWMERTDELGRMLGGWMAASAEPKGGKRYGV